MSLDSSVPAFGGNISFNAQHSPIGAFASFTCGHFGSRGGLAAQIGKPANQDLFIGVKQGDRYSETPLKCLPFYNGANASAAAAFEVEQANPDTTPQVVSYTAEQIKRHYGWATDRWVTEDFSFTIYTPFGPLPDPEPSHDGVALGVQESRYRLLPAIVAELTVDNTKGTAPKTAVFAINFPDPGARIIDRDLEAATGFAWRDQFGVVGRLITSDKRNAQGQGDVVYGDAFPIMRWTPDQAVKDRSNPVHLIGSCPGIGFTVPAGQKQTLRLVIGFYNPGLVTTRLTGQYRYTRLFTNIEDVLARGLDFSQQLITDAHHRDQALLSSGLSADQQFLIAHATRSYHGSTQLLDVAGQPWWIVNEGEYCMMNTLDLSVDQVFFELRLNPWVVRNLLENFVRYYSYHDQVKDPVTGKLYPGGISFAHDQGINNQFSPLGHSSYELTDMPGCFSHMTQEQVCNWSLIAACYVATTGDDAWLAAHRPTIEACLQSMFARDHHDPAKRDGVMKFDSSRCGKLGQEITTYDSLDHSLAQARNNLYVATKSWATYLGLSMMLDRLGSTESSKQAISGATRAARTITANLRPDGTIPAVFEKENPGYNSRILPAVEALIYPQQWSNQPHGSQAKAWIDPSGQFKELLAALKTHTLSLLNAKGTGTGFNRFADGGLKLSSTSNNTWISKVAIVQHVAQKVLGLHADPAMKKLLTADADAASVKWLTTGSTAYFAMSDQIVSGVAQGSKYYPRGIATSLWLG
jgi:xylan 1,4-beta-xylosidase